MAGRHTGGALCDRGRALDGAPHSGVRTGGFLGTPVPRPVDDSDLYRPANASLPVRRAAYRGIKPSPCRPGFTRSQQAGSFRSPPTSWHGSRRNTCSRGMLFSAFKVASWVQSKGRAYQLMSVSQTNYSRLRHAPLVAIGAFNNPWAMRVTAELRFVFDRRTIDGIIYNCINDRRNPNAVNWMVKQPAAGTMTEDYAIVTRVFDPVHRKDRNFSGRNRSLWHARRGRIRDRAGVCGSRAQCGSARLASQERSIRVDYENHRRHARAATGASHPCVVTRGRIVAT